ncbi:hypothetical protein KJ781_02860 [Patescibacteria group bacterium]|nr:hypothetical protein [Patescibacteria group bacterium]MBU1448649.1 hypothetical protein [Patescibacteria group bacterium]MBU2612907.1 hypothetical protein [Patescibacteria group bacterium]
MNQIPHTCSEWQEVLKAIAFGSEPEDPRIATGARIHALRCSVCRDYFMKVSEQAVREGHAVRPPLPNRAVTTHKNTAGDN